MSYKNKARLFIEAVNCYNENAIEIMVDENYIQHNPKVPTGRSAFINFLRMIKKYQTKIENIYMFEDGPFVIMHHIWKNAAPLGAHELYAFHIIRFNTKGLIAEHWSVMSERLSSIDQDEISPNKLHVKFNDSSFTLSIFEGLHLGNHSAIYELKHHHKGLSVTKIKIVQEVPKFNLANNNTMFGFA